MDDGDARLQAIEGLVAVILAEMFEPDWLEEAAAEAKAFGLGDDAEILKHRRRILLDAMGMQKLAS